MQNFFFRDKNNRWLYKTNEIKRLVYKSIISNQKELIEFRYRAHLFLINLNTNSFLVKIKNRCLLTGRSKSVYRKFRMSRLMFRKMALEGKLIGVKKSSW